MLEQRRRCPERRPDLAELLGGSQQTVRVAGGAGAEPLYLGGHVRRCTGERNRVDERVQLLDLRVVAEGERRLKRLDHGLFHALEAWTENRSRFERDESRGERLLVSPFGPMQRPPPRRVRRLVLDVRGALEPVEEVK